MTNEHAWSDEKVVSFVASMEQKLGERYTPFADQILQLSTQFLNRKPSLIVDIGCGPGFLGLELLRLVPGTKVIGVDPDDRMIRIAHQKAKEFGIRGFEGRLGDAERLPIEDGVADVIVTLSSIHHWQDVSSGISEVYRILKAGGLFIGKDRSRAQRNKQQDTGNQEKHHSKGLSPGEMTTLLQQSAFHIRLVEKKAKYTIVAQKS
jgi:ubiquinone/menaquinone biosynthesis C-methylase UbiE